VDFHPPDFVRIAEAFGIAGRRAAIIAEVRSHVEHALIDRVPLLMDPPIDYREYYDSV
jgi:thiamine pyrophosphate-dependent acetolactate synthase large subunit-like protein